MFQSQSCSLRILDQYKRFRLGIFTTWTHYLFSWCARPPTSSYSESMRTLLQSCCSNTMQLTYVMVWLVHGDNWQLTIDIPICTSSSEGDMLHVIKDMIKVNCGEQWCWFCIQLIWNNLNIHIANIHNFNFK